MTPIMPSTTSTTPATIMGPVCDAYADAVIRRMIVVAWVLVGIVVVLVTLAVYW